MTSTETNGENASARIGAGSQTLMRGLDVVEALSEGVLMLPELAERLGLAKSTTHRLASALVDRGYLAFMPRRGYRLGPKLLELGYLAQSQTDLIQIARPHIEALALASEDTVHLGILDDGRALYLDKIPGRRRINISSRIGDRQPLSSTGLGKALLIDHPADFWAECFAVESAATPARIDLNTWLSRMAGYADAGHAFDLEENEDQIRCVAAPVRDVRGGIIGAISVSSAAQYMDDGRMAALSVEVRATAQAISRDLGWADHR